MGATFALRFIQKELGEPTSMFERISAAHIILTMHSNSWEPDMINCNEPSEWGSYAMYLSKDWYLYNEVDITFGMDNTAWCNYPRYQQQLNNWNGNLTRYDYSFEDFEDGGLPFHKLAEWFWFGGLAITNVQYCSMMIRGAYPYPEDKYTCDPSIEHFVQWGTIIIFGVMEDYDGIWYAAYFMESTTAGG